MILQRLKVYYFISVLTSLFCPCTFSLPASTLIKLLKFAAIPSCKFTSLFKVFAMCMSFSLVSLSFNGTQIPILLHFSHFFCFQCPYCEHRRDDLTVLQECYSHIQTQGSFFACDPQGKSSLDQCV